MLSKADCDELLLACMVADGVNEEERKAIYEGVKFGGWKAFREDRAAAAPNPS